jgi:pimeloyl-ACP methyl ester carboxylesterase
VQLSIVVRWLSRGLLWRVSHTVFILLFIHLSLSFVSLMAKLQRMSRVAAVLFALAVLCVCGVMVTPVTATVPYTHANGLDALYFTKVTYCSEGDIRSWTCGMTCKRHNNFRVLSLITNPGLSLLSYVGIDDDTRRVVVAFRGAYDTSNIIGSSGVLPVAYDSMLGCGDDCKVHAVYQSYYGTLRFYIRRHVVGALQWNPTYSVLVTGHSMGGALAQLAATDLQTQIARYGFSPLPMVHLYTFGALRVGNKAYAAWAVNLLDNAAHFHVTHAQDPVPRLPPFTGLLGFFHVPHEIYYPANDATFIVCDDSTSAEAKNCINGAKGRNNDDHLFYLGVSTGCG